MQYYDIVLYWNFLVEYFAFWWFIYRSRNIPSGANMRSFNCAPPSVTWRRAPELARVDFARSPTTRGVTAPGDLDSLKLPSSRVPHPRRLAPPPQSIVSPHFLPNAPFPAPRNSCLVSFISQSFF